MKARIIGKKTTTRVDKNSGEVKTYRELHVEYMPAIPKDGMEGNEVDVIGCKFDTSSIKVGGIYDLEITKNNYQGRRYTTIESYSEVKA